MKVLFVRPNIDAFGFKPINLSLLIAATKQMGWNSVLYDTTKIDLGYTDNNKAGEKAGYFKPVDMTKYGHIKKKISMKKEYLAVVEKVKPTIIAMSVLSSEAPIAKRLVKFAKKAFPDIPIAWGGIHPTVCPSDCDVDHLFIGEGIDAFKRLLKKISEGYLKNSKSINEGELCRNLDDLPYLDWSLYSDAQFYRPFHGNVYRSGDYMTNWGCANNCRYCINRFYHKMYGNTLRRYSNERCIDELKQLKKTYNLEFFKFHDEDFLQRPFNVLKEFGQLYYKNVGLPFTTEANPNRVSRGAAKVLADMGCVSVSMGVETGNPYLRKQVLRRPDTFTDIKHAFQYLRDAGIKTTAFNMLGLPGETRDTYAETVALNRELKPDVPQMSFYYPFHGTSLRRYSIENGYLDPSSNGEYHWDKPALKFQGLTSDELIEMRNNFASRVLS